MYRHYETSNDVFVDREEYISFEKLPKNFLLRLIWWWLQTSVLGVCAWYSFILTDG
jgi:hypothetical protein